MGKRQPDNRQGVLVTYFFLLSFSLSFLLSFFLSFYCCLGATLPFHSHIHFFTPSNINVTRDNGKEYWIRRIQLALGLIHTKTESRNLGALGSCSFIPLHRCYSSVKYKSISLNCSTKMIKSAPKQKRYLMALLLLKF